MDTDKNMLKNNHNTAKVEKNKNQESASSDSKMSELNSLNREKTLWQFKKYHETQKEMVRKSMHRAMSPISAISGYLELIKMFLEKDARSEKIEKYRSKIEEGVNELEMIIEDLYDTFDEDDSNIKEDFNNEDVNLNSTRRAS